MDITAKEIECVNRLSAVSFLDDVLCMGDSKGVLHLFSNEFDRSFKVNEHDSSNDSGQFEITSVGLAGQFPLHKSILVSDQSAAKLWRVSEKKQKCVRQYTELHAFHIHSLAVHRHWPVFVTADELSILLWDIENGSTAHQLLGRTHSVYELEDVITSTSFSEADPALIVWTSTKGTVSVGDLRLSSVLKQPVAMFLPIANSAGFYSEVVNSVSSAKFIDQNFLVAREYYSLKFWDLRQQTRPSNIVQVLNTKQTINELYESGRLYDKFAVSASTTGGNTVVTGSYNGIEVLDSTGLAHRHIELCNDTAMLNVAVDHRGSRIAAVAGTKAVVLGEEDMRG